MKPEPLTAVDDVDWLSMRMELWPDCPRQRHLEEMASFLREPTRFVQFIVRNSGGRGIGFAEASVRTDYVNGTSSSPDAYLGDLNVAPAARGKGAVYTQLGCVETERAVFFSKSLGPGKAD